MPYLKSDGVFNEDSLTICISPNYKKNSYLHHIFSLNLQEQLPLCASEPMHPTILLPLSLLE
jgi:hypothetical protein